MRCKKGGISVVVCVVVKTMIYITISFIFIQAVEKKKLLSSSKTLRLSLRKGHSMKTSQ